jgi:uncharacterized membrane protein YhhN
MVDLRLPSFIPFAAIGAAHLLTLFIGWDAGSTVTKLAIMPALLLGLLLALPRRRGNILVFGSIGIVLSWSGDALLESPGDIGFLLGLGSFLLAHLAYLVLFAGPLRERRIPWLAGLYAVWWVALLVILVPHVGALVVPVAAYGLALAASAIAALGTNRLAMIGALVFLASDTILAFHLFYPGFEFWQIDFTIMLLYILGQGLIILGAVSRASSLNRASRLPEPQGL